MPATPNSHTGALSLDGDDGAAVLTDTSDVAQPPALGDGDEYRSSAGALGLGLDDDEVLPRQPRSTHARVTQHRRGTPH